jgi:hypothetical protein
MNFEFYFDYFASFLLTLHGMEHWWKEAQMDKGILS